MAPARRAMQRGVPTLVGARDITPARLQEEKRAPAVSVSAGEVERRIALCVNTVHVTACKKSCKKSCIERFQDLIVVEHDLAEV